MFTNFEILQAAIVRWQADFEMGKRDGTPESAGGSSMEMLVKPAESTANITDPFSDEIRIYFYETGLELVPDNGQVKYENLPVRELRLKGENYVKGIQEDLDKLRNPLVVELYGNVAMESGQTVRYTQRRELWRRLLKGDTAAYGLAWDSQLFFDTDHPGKSAAGAETTFSNLFDLALTETNLDTVITAMQGYRNAFGTPYGNAWRSSTMMQPQESRNERPAPSPSFHLYVGRKNAKLAAALANMATDNPSAFAGTFTWSVEEELEGDFEDYWFVQFYSARRKPICLVDGGSGVFAAAGWDTEPGRKHRRAEWTIRAKFGFTYCDWHAMAMCRA